MEIKIYKNLFERYWSSMSIVTKQGDQGQTKLFSGEEVSKDSIRPETYGTLDELISYMGLAKAISKNTRVKSNLEAAQKILFTVGTEIATKGEPTFKFTPIGDKELADIEVTIEDYEAELKLPPQFIVPGTNQTSATLDIARTICRRFERNLVTLFKTKRLKNTVILKYTNRLSDLLFLMARMEEK